MSARPRGQAGLGFDQAYLLTDRSRKGLRTPTLWSRTFGHSMPVVSSALMAMIVVTIRS